MPASRVVPPGNSRCHHCYVLVAIVKKRLNLDASLYTFEKMPILHALSQHQPKSTDPVTENQLNLFAG